MMIPLVTLIFAVSAVPKIQSPSFVYSFGERAYWENRLAHQRIDLGTANQVELEVGDKAEEARPVILNPVHLESTGSAPNEVLDQEYVSDDRTLKVDVTLQADSRWPLMHKYARVENTGDKPVRVLSVVLGRFPIGDGKLEGGDRGFPLYVDRSFFVSITHPAGFAHVEGKDVVLRQYPGKLLTPGRSFLSMEAIFGVSKQGQARQTFVDYVKSRMCRVLAGQAKPYAILESFGGQETGDFRNEFTVGVSENYLHENLTDVARARTENAVQFDFYSLEFWQDRAGDLTTFNRRNFPNGFGATRDEILARIIHVGSNRLQGAICKL